MSRATLLVLLAPALAALTFLAVSAPPDGFPLDDAWIHLVYARSLALGDGLAYNPGVPASGCTSPLWAMLLVPTQVLGGQDPARLAAGARVLGVLVHTAGVAMLWRVLPRGTLGLGAALGVATSPLLLFGALSGMEVPLATLLLLATVAAAEAGAAGWAGLAVALAGATRPEAALATLPALGVLLWRHPRRAWRAVPAPLLVGALLVGWNLYATGRPLPATFYMKLDSPGTTLLRRLGDVWELVLPQVSPLSWQVLPFVALLAPLRRREAALPLATAGLFVVANTLVVDPYSGYAFYNLRYLLPAAPLLVLAAARGLEGLPGRRGQLAEAAPGVFALAGLALTGPTFTDRYANDIRNINEVQVAMGREVGAMLPEGAWVAASDAGAVRYLSERPVVDVMGLNTFELYTVGDEWARAHPVAAFAIMTPAWFVAPDPALTQPVRAFRSERYTVTAFARMRTQGIYRCVADGPVRLRGMRSPTVWCRPPGPADAAPPRGGPSGAGPRPGVPPAPPSGGEGAP